jgi:hypothetical protein
VSQSIFFRFFAIDCLQNEGAFDFLEGLIIDFLPQKYGMPGK